MYSEVRTKQASENIHFIKGQLLIFLVLVGLLSAILLVGFFFSIGIFGYSRLFRSVKNFLLWKFESKLKFQFFSKAISIRLLGEFN